MKRYDEESWLGQTIKDFVYKYGPCGLNQLIYGVELQVSVITRKELLWEIKGLCSSGVIETSSSYQISSDGETVVNPEIYVTRNRGSFRNSRGYEMAIWGALFIAKNEIDKDGFYYLQTERHAPGPSRKYTTSRTFVTSVYSCPESWSEYRGEELDGKRYYIFNGETKHMGMLKLEVDALGAADSESHIIIVSDNRKVFDVIPEVKNPLSVYFFNTLPKWGLPNVEIYNRNY